MDALIYVIVLFAAAAALVSLSYVWIYALRAALRSRAANGGRGAARFWPLLIVAFGWLGALLYWKAVASSH